MQTRMQKLVAHLRLAVCNGRCTIMCDPVVASSKEYARLRAGLPRYWRALAREQQQQGRK
jgi:hypothetical protein